MESRPSKHVKPTSGTVFERIDIGAQFVATHGPLRDFFNRQNVLSGNMARPNPVANRALGLQSQLLGERLLASDDSRRALDGLLAHAQINAQTVTRVNAESGTAASDTHPVTQDVRKTFWQRLVECFREAGLPTSGNGIAGQLDMSQGSVNRWQRNEGLPELDTVRDLALKGRVCVEWLLTGRGPKRPIRHDEETMDLLRVWSELNENGRHHVRMAAASALALQKQPAPVPNPTET